MHKKTNNSILDEFIKQQNVSLKKQIIKLFYKRFRYETDYSFEDLLNEIKSTTSLDINDFGKSTPNINIGFSTAETAIEKLFHEYQNNTCLEIVAVKVAIINQFYSAGLYSTDNCRNPSVIEMSKRTSNHTNWKTIQINFIPK